MNTIITVPAGNLRGLNVQQGDTLRILSSEGEQIVMELQRAASTGELTSGSAKEWLQAARGSIRLEANESVDDVLREYHSKKYGMEH